MNEKVYVIIKAQFDFALEVWFSILTCTIILLCLMHLPHRSGLADTPSTFQLLNSNGHEVPLGQNGIINSSIYVDEYVPFCVRKCTYCPASQK